VVVAIVVVVEVVVVDVVEAVDTVAGAGTVDGVVATTSSVLAGKERPVTASEVVSGDEPAVDELPEHAPMTDTTANRIPARGVRNAT
jgi:hypothetical protein